MRVGIDIGGTSVKAGVVLDGDNLKGENMRVGIDIGGTSVKAGVVLDGSIIYRASFPTDKNSSEDDFIYALKTLVCRLAEGVGVFARDFQSIGIGYPGIIEKGSGVARTAGNLLWRNFDIKTRLAIALDMDIKKLAIINDADAAALAEALYGSARGLESSIMLTLGTGLGGGVVLFGRLVEGSELGHFILNHGKKRCTCGQRGCFEAYASVTGLLSIIEQEGANYDTFSLFAAYREGEKSAQKIVKRYAKYLAAGIKSLYNIFHNAAFVLGGGLSAESDTLIPLIYKNCRDCYGGFGAKIFKAALGNDAGIIGASEAIGQFS